MHEIERKFRVREVPADRGEGTPIRQGYVAIDEGVSVRVRARGGTYVLTIKSGGASRVRTEVEVELDEERFAALWPLTEGRRIEKRRHELVLARHTAELDLYEGHLDGLATVEVEFPSEGEADGFEPPGWFGDELTGLAAWSNASLAVHGLPE